MKKFLYHFRIQTIIGLSFLAVLSAPISLQNFSAHHDAEITPETTTAQPPAEILDPDLPDLPKEPLPEYQFESDLIIKAINPGYTVDGARDVGEFIELQKISDTTSLSLAGYAIWYVNSSGNETLLLDFAEGSSLVGETLLVRLARSPDSDRADATYMTTLAMSAGKINLVYQAEIIDTICWGGKECAASFKGTKPTSLVRDLNSGEFSHSEDYQPAYDPEQPSLVLPPEEELPDDPGTEPDSVPNLATCAGLEFSEIFSYYTNSQTEQFIEFYNPTDHQIQLSGCSVRYKNKIYPLEGSIEPSGYYVFYPSQNGHFNLTKNPSSSNTIELISSSDELVDVLSYPHGQKKSASFAKFYDHDGAENWQVTYQPTPGRENLYQEFRTCAEGKVINPATGNCVKATTATKTVQECAEGQYRNPLTGRCKKIESSSDPKPCAEGYERNPQTGRCRKIVSPNDGTDYALVPETYSSQKTFTALGIVLLIVGLGILYIVLQFRREILRTMRKVRQRLHHIGKNLITRSRGIHRNQKT